MSLFRHRPEPLLEPDADGLRRIWPYAVALVVVVVAAYFNSFGGPFVFDDLPSIVENPAVKNIWSDVSSSTVDQPGGLTTSGRPVVRVSLALNYALSGPAVGSYHAVNVLIHVAAALCLFGVVRRTFLTAAVGARIRLAALPLAFSVACLWALHPLLTESVTYIVQRAESLAALWYLLTLYCFIRCTAGPHARLWSVLAIVACALGMGTKETVASAPVVVLLYDGVFISGTLGAAWRRHRSLYLMLGASWIGLALLLIGTGGRGGTAGFGTDASPWFYALTQCKAIVHYLALSFWPRELVFDYGMATVRDWRTVAPQALLIAGVIGGIVLAVRHRPSVGFAGVCFLALLAPSSSVIPVVTQTMAEHRMYLPLAVALAVGVAGLYSILGFRAIQGAAGAALALALVTANRNRDYRSDEAIWSDTVIKLPTNARAHNNLGQALFRADRIDASISSYERALQLQPMYPEPHYNLGVALARLGRLPAAIEHYETALRLQPVYPEAFNNLGNALVRVGRLPEALAYYERALAARPDFAEAHNNLGNALLQAGRPREAEAKFKRALALKADYAEARYNLGNTYAALGLMTDALVQYLASLKANPRYAEAEVNAGNALLALERSTEAIVHYERAVALAPELADAHFNLGSALLDLGREAEAIPRLEKVLLLDPDRWRAHRPLGFALGRVGRVADALYHYEHYLQRAPDDAAARVEWEQLRARR